MSSKSLSNKVKKELKCQNDAMEIEGVRTDGSNQGAKEEYGDEPPETLPSNTKRAPSARSVESVIAAAAAAAEQEESEESESGGDSDREEEGDDSDGGDGETGDDDSFGKRKVDEFLRRRGLAMDASFKSSVVLPGDDVTEQSTRATKNLRLGPGLVQRGEKVLVTRAGMLRYRPPCTFWVESNGRRYTARTEDQVLGVVEDRSGEAYRVNIFGRCTQDHR